MIAGGGPTGAMLAAELRLTGVDAVVVERRTGPELESSRAGGLHARALEVLDQRGVADRFLAAGTATQVQGFAGIRLDISDFPTRFNHGLALWQRDVERILGDWVFGDLEAPIRRGCEVVGFTQDGSGVDVALSDGTSLRAGYLVGCDGGRSLVRKTAGIEFAGWDPSVSFLIAELDLAEPPPVGMRPEGGGIGPVDAGSGGNPYRVVLKEERADVAGSPTLDDVRAALTAAYGTDFGAHDPSFVSRFTDMSRQARVFALLHAARPVLLDLGGSGGPRRFDISPWADRVDLVEAEPAEPAASGGSESWDLPVVGPVPAPAAVLIRPDGHVAWAGDLPDPALPRALTTWFGPARSPASSGSADAARHPT